MMKYATFDDLIRRAPELGYRVTNCGGSDKWRLDDKDGRPLLCVPTDRVRLESFLRMQFALFGRES